MEYTLEQANALRQGVLNLYQELNENPDTKVLLEKNFWFEKKAEPCAAKLEKGEYKIGIVGVQSSGKSTILNMMLDYPLLPCAARVTTGAVVELSYSEEVRLEVIAMDGEAYPVDVAGMPQPLFQELKKYFCMCHRKVGLDHLIYFTDMDLAPDENGNPCEVPIEELDLSYADPMHRLVLLTNLTALYVDQNEKEKDAEDTRLNNFRRELLHKIGVPEEVENFRVKIGLDSEILRSGLTLVDLPGTGSATQETEKLKSHNQITMAAAEEAPVIILVMTPFMSEADIRPAEPILQTFTYRNMDNIEERLIPVANKIDMVPQGGSYKVDAEKLYEKLGMPISHTYGISAISAEHKIFCARPAISKRSYYWRRQSKMIPPQMQAMMDGGQIVEMLEQIYVQQSHFQEFYDYVLSYHSKFIMLESFQLLKYLFNSINNVLMEREICIHVKEGLLNNMGGMVQKCVVNYLQEAREEISKIAEDLHEELEKSKWLFENRVLNSLTATQDKFLDKIDVEHKELKDDVASKRKKMKKNIVGDIVLSRKNGKEKTSNQDIFNGIVDTLQTFDYPKSFNYLSSEMRKLCLDYERHMKAQVETHSKKIKDEYRRLEECLGGEMVDQWYKKAANGLLYAAAAQELQPADRKCLAEKIAEHDKTMWEQYVPDEGLRDKICGMGVLEEEEIEKLKGYCRENEESEQIALEFLNILDDTAKKIQELPADGRNGIDAQMEQVQEFCDKKQKAVAFDCSRMQMDFKNNVSQKNSTVVSQLKTNGVIATKTELVVADSLDNILNNKLEITREEERNLRMSVKAEFERIKMELSENIDMLSYDITRVFFPLAKTIDNIGQNISSTTVENVQKQKEEIQKEKEALKHLEPKGPVYEVVENCVKEFEPYAEVETIVSDYRQCEKEVKEHFAG